MLTYVNVNILISLFLCFLKIIGQNYHTKWCTLYLNDTIFQYKVLRLLSSKQRFYLPVELIMEPFTMALECISR